MSKKNNIMSLSLDPDTQEKLRLHAKQKTNGNVSKLIRELVDKYLVLEDDVIPVILRIPMQYKGDEESLKNWLDIKVGGIVKALSN
jgi:hypothetical protein